MTILHYTDQGQIPQTRTQVRLLKPDGVAVAIAPLAPEIIAYCLFYVGRDVYVLFSQACFVFFKGFYVSNRRNNDLDVFLKALFDLSPELLLFKKQVFHPLDNPEINRSAHKSIKDKSLELPVP